jgi:hypothetical protein
MHRKKIVIFSIAAAFAIASSLLLAMTNGSTPDLAQSTSRCTRIPDKKPKKGQTSRCTRLTSKHKKGKFLANEPPTVSLAASDAASNAAEVTVRANATDVDGDTLLYTYSTTGGRVRGDGPEVKWDLSGAAPGAYTVTVEVDDGCGCIAFTSAVANVTEQQQ